MTVSLIAKRIPFDSKRRVSIWFQGLEVGHHCVDLVVRETVLVELKAVDEIADVHFARLRSYLKAANLRVGLLINFNTAKLTVSRSESGAGHHCRSYHRCLRTMTSRFRFSPFRIFAIPGSQRLRSRFPLDSADLRWYFRCTDVE